MPNELTPEQRRWLGRHMPTALRVIDEQAAALAESDALKDQLTEARVAHKQTCYDRHLEQGRADRAEAQLAEARAYIKTQDAVMRCRCTELELHNAEARALLERIVKYATEDQARTPGTTRLARAVDEAKELLIAANPESPRAAAEDEDTLCSECNEPVQWGSRHAECGRKAMAPELRAAEVKP